MIALILLLVSVLFQITTNWFALGDEIIRNTLDEGHYDALTLPSKRYLGALAKNNRIPIQQRSYLIPPMVSPYGSGQKAGYVDEYDSKGKRYLGSLVKGGDPHYGKSQQKKSAADLENDELDEFSFRNKEDLPNPTIMKQEMISNLKPVLLQILDELKKKYDPSKVDLFLENLANAIYDQNEEISLENIRALVVSDYFQPEENIESRKKEALKRNIQSMVRDFNVSYSGMTPSEIQARQIRVPKVYRQYQFDLVKRNLESLIKNKSLKRYLGAMAKNRNIPAGSGVGKREMSDDFEYLNENGAPYRYNDEEEYFKSMSKRHTMYDINEPDITFEYPSQAGEQNDYNDYAEQMGQDASAIPIGKRYIGLSMSLRNLVEDQCGTANSLVQLTSHFVQDRGLTDQGLLHPFQHENYQNQGDEAAAFLDMPENNSQSFRMDSLLAEMRELEVAAVTTNINAPDAYASPVLKTEGTSDWANQYLESGSSFAHIEDNPYQQNIWSNEKENQLGNKFDISRSLDVNEFNFNANWGREYFKQGSPIFSDIHGTLSDPPYPMGISELQYVAGQVVDTMNDARFSDSKFLKFMNQVSEGSVQITSNQMIGAEAEEHVFNKWANKSVISTSSNDTVTTDTNAKERLFSQWGSLPTPLIGNQNKNINTKTSTSTSESESKVREDVYSKELWSKLTERWEQLNIANQDPWDTEFNKFVASVQAYTFAEENPMADKVNALEEGKKRLEEGDLPSAVLCFEAAVKQNPENVEGWQLLGRTQAENEQDQQAIAALKKCIQLDPSNLEALQEIAVCYTNENYHYQACYALKEWLARNPKYQDIVKESADTSESDKINDVTSILTMKFFNEVLNLYLKAVQLFAEFDDADPDIQNGLGVLLTLSSEYDKAIDCFQTAVKLRPNDYRLWNRLGATLANGQKPEQALEAYRKTLKLSPGFIRARYNLGITCVHLQMYKQSVEHLLIALNQQVAGRGIHGEKSYSMSESIWTTLKLALSMMDKKELIPFADKRDLTTLSKEFNISSLDDMDSVNKESIRSSPNDDVGNV